MGALITVDLDLIKEANDIVEQMTGEIVSLKEKYASIEKELNEFKEAAEREKIADILDEKSLVPYEKVVAYREGKLSKEENESLKSLAQINVDYISHEHQPTTKTASFDFREASEEASSLRRQQRAERLQEELESLKNNY